MVAGVSAEACGLRPLVDIEDQLGLVLHLLTDSLEKRVSEP